MAATSANTDRVRRLLEAALLLEPDRIDLHVELAALEVGAGRVVRAAERIEMLAQEYSRRAESCTGERVFSGSGWEREFDQWWERYVDPEEDAQVEELRRRRERERVFARYSIPTLRARVRVRRGSASTRKPEISLAASLRKLGRLDSGR